MPALFFNRELVALTLAVMASGCGWSERVSDLEARVDKIESEMVEQLKSMSNQEKSISNQGSQVAALRRELTQLRDETRGVGTRTVDLSKSEQMITLFGNQSGRNATVTVSHVGASPPSSDDRLLIRVARISKPSDDLERDDESSVPDDELPIDMEITKPLDLTPVGASRELVVPCGFQVEGQTTFKTRINMRIELSSDACS